MIEVSGEARLRVNFTVRLNMTEDEFDNLTFQQQMALLDEYIDWHNVLSNAELDDIDVDELYEVE